MFGGFGIHAVDRLDTQQSVEFLVVLRWAHLARDHIAGAQAKAADLRLRDIDIHPAGHETPASQEAEALLDDFEDTRAEDVALPLGLGLEQSKDQFLLAERGIAGKVAVAGNIT